MEKAGRRRLTAACIAAAIGVAALASFAIAERPADSQAARAGNASGCKNADEAVRTLTRGAVRKAVLCLLNKERRGHARKPVARSMALQRAAQVHSKAMVATDCLSHQCPGEISLERRIRRSGYLADAKAWEYAENTGCGLNAEAMVANWMASRYHRINILNARYDDVGIGIVERRVERRCGKGYGTFTLVTAFREP